MPELGIPGIKAKIDSGARTSALHTFEIRPFTEAGKERVRFAIHPLQKRSDIVLYCVADIHDRRWVSDSGGHREYRYIVKTNIALHRHCWPIEITLTDRDPMRFRMLLGRTAMQGRVIIDPDASFLTGFALRKQAKQLQRSGSQKPA